MKRLKLRSSSGFTIVELMIATVIFSVILLGAASSLIQIGKMYYKGVISSRTQGAARTIIDDISRAIQFSGEEVTEVEEFTTADDEGLAIQKGAICIGSTRYTYLLNAQVSDTVADRTYENHRTPHALWRDTTPAGQGCNEIESGDLPELATRISTTAGEELLDQHMRLASFKLTPIPNPSTDPSEAKLWEIEVTVIYGDDDLLNDPDAPTACKGAVAGSQWCAVSTLKTQVSKRAGE